MTRSFFKTTKSNLESNTTEAAVDLCDPLNQQNPVTIALEYKSRKPPTMQFIKVLIVLMTTIHLL